MKNGSAVRLQQESVVSSAAAAVQQDLRAMEELAGRLADLNSADQSGSVSLQRSREFPEAGIDRGQHLAQQYGLGLYPVNAQKND